MERERERLPRLEIASTISVAIVNEKGGWFVLDITVCILQDV